MSFSALQVYQWGCRSINLFSKQTGAALVSKLRNGTSRIPLLPFLHRSPCLPEVEFTAYSRNRVDNTLLFLAESAASFHLTKWGLEVLCRPWKWFKRLVATVSGLVAMVSGSGTLLEKDNTAVDPNPFMVSLLFLIWWYSTKMGNRWKKRADGCR